MESCLEDENIESGEKTSKGIPKLEISDSIREFLNENPQILQKLLVTLQQLTLDANIDDCALNSYFEEILNQIIVSNAEFKDVGLEEFGEYLTSVCSSWIPIPQSHIEATLLEKSDDGIVLKHHGNISNILSYLDAKSIVAFSLCSHSTLYATMTHINKVLYNLPFNKIPICSNISFWKRAIDFFFNHAVTLSPVDRNDCSSVMKQLNINKSLFPITTEAMKSHVYITLDYIQPHYIVYCNHEIPMSHTSSVSNSLDCDNKANTKSITLSDFISEYKQRIQIKDDSLVWGLHYEQITVDFACLLLKTLLGAIATSLSEHNGKIEYRKTEYISNAKYHITHRIWLQASLMWDYRFGDEAQNTLYLTIADHFSWDG